MATTDLGTCAAALSLPRRVTLTGLRSGGKLLQSHHVIDSNMPNTDYVVRQSRKMMSSVSFKVAA